MRVALRHEWTTNIAEAVEIQRRLAAGWNLKLKGKI
jgi:hypothetical protein